MIVTEYSYTEAQLEQRDYRDTVRIEIDGGKVFEVAEGEPEDMSFGRNLNDCFEIVDLRWLQRYLLRVSRVITTYIASMKT